jgi:hypothetical protein
MPDSKTHKYVAITAGVGFTAYRAKERAGLNFLLEVLGGGLGAWSTGNLPDIFEPAVSSWHRSTFHSVTVGGTIVSQANTISAFTDFCREQAANCKENPKRILMIPVSEGVSVPIELDGTIGRFFSFIEQCLWLLLAGFVAGAAAGYVSHLALDGLTGKRSLPLITRGF